MSPQQQPARPLQAGNDTITLPFDTITRRDIVAAVGEDAPWSLQTLLRRARPVYHAPQEVLYHQGGHGGTVYFITDGLLKLVSHLSNGRARIVRLHRSGSVLGLSGQSCVLNEHTAVAVTSVSALRLPLSAVQRLRSMDPSAYVTLVEHWHDYLSDADIWITQFSTGPIHGRVARLLAFLSDIAPRYRHHTGAAADQRGNGLHSRRDRRERESHHRRVQAPAHPRPQRRAIQRDL